MVAGGLRVMGDGDWPCDQVLRDGPGVRVADRCGDECKARSLPLREEEDEDVDRSNDRYDDGPGGCPGSAGRTG